MKKITLIAVVALAAGSLFNACTVQKRLYTGGYNISWNKKLKQSKHEQVTSQEISEDLTAIQPITPVVASSENAPIIDQTTDLQVAPTTDQVALDQTAPKEAAAVEVATEQPSTPVIKAESTVKKAIKKQKDDGESTSHSGGKNQIVALILCLLFGVLGIHRFYLGYTGLGVLYLFTLGLFGIGFIIDLILLIIPNGLTPKGKDNYKS